MIVKNHLRITCRTGAEAHQHRIGSYRSLCTGRTGPLIALLGNFCIEVDPAFLLLTPGNAADDLVIVLVHILIESLGAVVITGDDRHLDMGAVDTIDIVFRHQLVGRHNGNGTDLVERQYREPELVSSLQYQEDAVALLDALALKEVGRHIGILSDIAESESLLFVVFTYPEDRRLIRCSLCDLIHYIVCEVKCLRIRYFIVLLQIIEGNEIISVSTHKFFIYGHGSNIPFHYDRQKFTRFPVSRLHSMRYVGIKVHAVAFA